MRRILADTPQIMMRIFKNTPQQRSCSNDNSGITMQHRRAYQAPHTGGVANGHLVKRWTNEELLLPGQVVDQALIAALCSEEGDEAEGAEGCYLGAH
jgi:hypothetical protein